ncbi:hypothetical protein ED733_002124 [Metarhizium rileyi]|uniref:Uncharacterized protein n=1 Tax=Metarhizium rileyi (strain RCEF 4871) TaxID=1649241 RepID=A0A5C6FZL3_METRR|nr:hypothetical protein ED733_002124 [Metarhizium rileyi]
MKVTAVLLVASATSVYCQASASMVSNASTAVTSGTLPGPLGSAPVAPPTNGTAPTGSSGSSNSSGSSGSAGSPKTSSKPVLEPTPKPPSSSATSSEVAETTTQLADAGSNAVAPGVGLAAILALGALI